MSPQHQPRNRHSPAAAVAECACHESASSATSEPAPDVVNALKSSFAKPSQDLESFYNFFDGIIYEISTQVKPTVRAKYARMMALSSVE